MYFQLQFLLSLLLRYKCIFWHNNIFLFLFSTISWTIMFFLTDSVLLSKALQSWDLAMEDVSQIGKMFPKWGRCFPSWGKMFPKWGYISQGQRCVQSGNMFPRWEDVSQVGEDVSPVGRWYKAIYKWLLICLMFYVSN